MPHLKNPKLLSEMRGAVADIVQTRSTFQALGTRADHESVDKARLMLAEIDARSSDSEALQEDYKIYKAVIALEELHDAYKKLLSDAENRLEKIYEAALAGDEAVDEEDGDFGEEEVDEEVVAILKEVEARKKAIERIDLSERRLRTFPEAFGRVKSLVVLNLSNNQLEDILRDTEDHVLGLSISHFFNCFVGNVQSVSAEGVVNGLPSKTKKKVHSMKSSKGLKNGNQRKKEPFYLGVTSDSLWSDIQEFAKLKYQFELPEDVRKRVKKNSVIQNLCQKVGITIVARKYDFDNVAPFQVLDILNIQPVMKHSIPVCSEAKALVENSPSSW